MSGQSLNMKMASSKEGAAVALPIQYASSSEGTLIVLNPDQSKGYNDYVMYVNNSMAMRQVTDAMKEIAELPSETPTDVQPLQQVVFPEEGGVLTYMGGMEHPYKGFPFFEFVDRVDAMKKILRGVLSSFFHSLKKRNKVQLLFLLTVPWLFNDFVKSFVYPFFRMVERFRIKPIRHCTAIRELHRVFSVQWQGETEESKNTREMFRDLLCMVLEFDNAYRFRFQDIMVELDKDALRKNPAKEITRLLDLMSSREATQEIKDTWTLVRRFLPLYLRFNKPVRKTLVGILENLDLTKIELSVEDKDYCHKRKDYNFQYQLCQIPSTLNTATPL